MHTPRSSQAKGFTFIEVILYMGIVILMIGAIIPFMLSVIDFGIKNNTQQEVYAASRYVSERIKYEVRNAQALDVSDFDVNIASDEAKQFAVHQVGSSDSKRFFIANNTLFIQKGSEAPVALTSDDIHITNLVFTNHSTSDGTKEAVEFSITVEAHYPMAFLRQEYKESVTIKSGARVRSH